jgi:hypothetical protein
LAGFRILRKNSFLLRIQREVPEQKLSSSRLREQTGLHGSRTEGSRDNVVIGKKSSKVFEHLGKSVLRHFIAPLKHFGKRKVIKELIKFFK